MADKKSDLDRMLNNESPQPPIRRGQGVRLSTDASAVAESQNSEIAEQRNHRNAETQLRPKRVSRGYMLREDLIKGCKRLAVEEDRNLYEVMEEALEQYLERHTGDATTQQRGA